MTDSSQREFAWVTDLDLRVDKRVVVRKSDLTLENYVKANFVHLLIFLKYIYLFGCARS